MSENNDPQIEDVNSDAVATLRAGIAVGKPRHYPGFKPYAIVPEHSTVALLEPEPGRPQRIKVHPKFDEAASLAIYFNRFEDESSTLICDLDTSMVRAIIDHSDRQGARYHEHLATFTAKHSPEWKVWAGPNNGRKMGQVEFAQFIEDNAPDVMSPSSGDLYEMALKFEATKSAEFKSAIRQDNGSVNIGFKDDTVGSAGGGSITIPKEIVLRIPVYQGAEPEQVIARFRYRLNGSELSLWYDLLRIENLKRAAFQKIVAEISELTGKVVLAGRPS